MADVLRCQSASATLMTISTGGTNWTVLNPQKNQIGVGFFLKGSGGTLEIAGMGISTAFTNTGTSFVLMGQNFGLSLAVNGNGYPVFSNNTSALQFYVQGTPTIWFTSGGTTSQLAVLYYTDGPYQNGL